MLQTYLFNPTDECLCGCGQKAPLAPQTSRRMGWVKGEPLRYVRGHNKAALGQSRTGIKHSSVEKTRAYMLAHPERWPAPPVVSDEEKQRRGARWTGEANPRWKGGISQETRTARSNHMGTREYREWRTAVFERDDYTCRDCGARGNGVYLNAHHIKEYTAFPELRTVVSNGLTLCESCHRIRTWGGG